jgi:multiple sugar transport system substrate-binding protein
VKGKGMNRRDFLRLSVGAAAGSLLVACAPKATEKAAEEPTKAPEQPVEEPAEAEEAKISILWRTSSSENPMIDALVELYKQKQPSATVEAVYVPWDEFEPKLMTMYAGNIAPDIYGTGGTNPWVERVYRGMVKELDPYMDQDPALKEDLHPVGVQSYTIAGKMIAMPLCLCPAAVSINATRFDEAGLEYPPVDWSSTAWTWDEVIDTAKKMTLDKDGDGKIDQYGFNPGHASPWYYTRLWGEDLVSDDDYASGILHKWQTDKPEVYEAAVAGLQARADAIYKDEVTPSPETASALGQIGDVLKTGAVAMNFTGGWALWGDLPEEFEFRYAINPLGGANGSGTRVENTWVDPVQISSQSQNPDAAWAFTKFLVADTDALQIQIKARSVIPAAKSAFDAYLAEYSSRLAMTEQEQRTFFTGCLDQAKTTVPCHILVGWAAIRDIFNAELELVWLGERTAKDAMDAMIPKVNTKLEENLKELNLT